MEGDIVVVGGGISGLATAYNLKKQGNKVLLLEKTNRGGGVVHSLQESGFLYESGPNLIVDEKGAIEALCNELGIASKKIVGRKSPKERFILKNKKLHPLPFNTTGFFKSNLLSLKAKLRLCQELFKKKAVHEETVADFFSRRLGVETSDYIFGPLVSGIYGGDPKKLSLRHVFPEMLWVEQKYRSFLIVSILQFLKKKKQNDNAQKVEIVSFQHGLETLVQALTSALQENFVGDSEVSSIKKDQGKYVILLSNGEQIITKQLVLATPSYITATLLSNILPDLSQALNEIKYAPLISVHIGINRESLTHPLDGVGYFSSLKENKKILNSIWISSVFPERNPAEMLFLTNFIGGERSPELLQLSDSEITELVAQELKEAVGVMAEPAFVKIIRHERAIPQYTIDYSKALLKIDEIVKAENNLHLVGSYKGGVSVSDCAHSGAKLASKIGAEMREIYG